MTRAELDFMWNRALQDAIKAGEDFTRYHFAALVAAHEREECARVCEQLERPDDSTGWNQGSLDCAKAIRARGDL